MTREKDQVNVAQKMDGGRETGGRQIDEKIEKSKFW